MAHPNNILEADEVVGVDVQKVRAGLWLMMEGGLPQDSINTITWELSTSKCNHCERHWPRSASPVVTLPTWHWAYERKDVRPKGWPSKTLREEVKSHLDGYAEGWAPSFRWRDAQTCPDCVMKVADKLAASVVALPKKKLLNIFCRTYALTIERMKAAHDEDRGWKATKEYTGYVAVTNALMQHLSPRRNERAWASLMQATKHLGML